MDEPTLQQLSEQLESPNSRDRLLALAQLREFPAKDAFPLLKKVLYDEHMPVRSMAILGLGIKQTEESLPLLVKLLVEDEDYGIRADAAGALGYLGDIRAFEPLVRAFLEDTTWLVQFSAAVSLGNLEDPRAYDVLIRALDREETVIQMAAIGALGEIRAVEATDRILEFVQSSDWMIRRRVAESLGSLPSPKSAPALKYLAKDDHPQVREAAILGMQALQSIEGATE
ncbi:MAG: HEAT repeat domain-containing protein [Cyanobacteria bacterium P01_F01_bin.42]